MTTESTAPIPREALQRWSVILLGAALVLAAMLATYATTEFTLGLVFAAPLFAMVVALALTALPRRITDDLLACAVISLCAATPVLFASIAAGALTLRWVQEFAVTFTVTCAAVGAVRFLVRMRVPTAIAQAIVLLISLSWLAFPIWGSKLFTHGPGARLGPPLLDLHPLIALNGAYPELGDWTHQPLAYQYLMNLGQDVPFVPPTNVWASALLHTALAALLFAASYRRRRPMSIVG